jgi:hypothetical protein
VDNEALVRLPIRAAPILCLLAFACGGPTVLASYEQSHSATQITSDASKSLKSVHSAHLTFQGTSAGSSVSADIDAEDKNFNGKISIQGGSFRMIVADSKVYINGPDLVAFMKITDPAVAAQVNALIGTKWVLLPSSLGVDASTMGSLSDFSGMADCITSDSKVTKKGTSTIGGDAVVEVDAASGLKVFVQIASPHYPRRIEFPAGSSSCNTAGSTTASDSGSIEFSKFGSHFGIKAPADFTDLTKLGL